MSIYDDAAGRNYTGCQSLTAAVRRNDIGPTVHACVVTRIQDVLYDTTSLASDYA